MNPELFGVDVITTGAAVAGYAIGQYADQKALKQISLNREESVLAAEGAGTAAKRLKFSRIFAPLAVIGAITGYTLAAGFEPNDGSSTEATALVTTVVDHDYISSTDGVAAVENRIASSFSSGNKAVVNHIITAHNGTSDPTTPSGLSKDKPYGPASVEDTVASSLAVSFNNAPNSQTNLLKNIRDKSGAEVVMIDNYDVITDPGAQTIEANAKNAGNIPVFFLNITGSGQPPANRPNIEDIANKTGGMYWSVSPANYQQVIGQMEANIKPHNTIQQPGGDTLPYKVIGIVLTGLGIYMYNRRKTETAT